MIPAKGSAFVYTDLFGKTRYKVNLHAHSTDSDGARSPDEVMELYRRNGYDALAITDHWCMCHSTPPDGLTLISGVEYHTGTHDSLSEIYHILGLGLKNAPDLKYGAPAAEIVQAIHNSGGIAVLAHPAWSLNTPEQLLALDGIDATEIYNTVSGAHNSRRPDSSLILDMVASRGKIYPLLASDDAHYYTEDACKSFVMVRADEVSVEAIRDGLRCGDYYASQGPEIHAWLEGNCVMVRTSPVVRINFHTGFRWRNGTSVRGEGLTEASWEIPENPGFVRVSAEDENGCRAWTGYLDLSSLDWEKNEK